MAKEMTDKLTTTGPAEESPLSLPNGDVLIRKVRGPDGIHPMLGAVKTGRIYTIDAAAAAGLCAGAMPEFAAATAADRTAIEAASNAAMAKASGKN